MAFNITAQLQLQGPANLRPVIQSIQNGLRNIQAEVNVTINQASLSSLANLNRQLTQVQGALTGVAASTGTAVGAINNVTTATTSAVSANTQYAASSSRVVSSNKAIAAAFEEGSSAAENFGKAAGLAARRYTAFLVAGGAIVGFVQGIKDATAEAFEFERELIRLNQVGAGTRADIKGIQDEITRLSTSLGVSSKDLAQASVTLAQAGLNARQTKEALEALAQAALSPSFGKLSDTVEGAIAVMSQFKIESKDLGQALGAMNAVAAGFAVESKDLIDAIKRAGGAFRASGGDLNEFLALFTSVRATTRESGEAIATGLRTVFTRLQRNDTVESLKSLGIELRRSRTEALALGDIKLEGQFVGAYEAVRRLSEALKSIPGADPRFSAIVEQLGGYRQISRVIPLIQEFTKANEALTVAQLGQFSLQNSANQAQEGTIIRLEKLRQQFLALFRTITESKGFQVFLDILIKVGEGLNTIANIATNLIPVFGALAAVKIGTSVVSLASGLGTGLFGGVQQSRGVIRRAGGGMVPGYGDGDTVPALLEPGEYVLRKRAVQAIGPENLAQLNQGGPVRAYNTGSPGRVLSVQELENLRKRIENKDPLADKFIGLYTGINTPQGIRQFKDRLVRNEQQFDKLPRGLGQAERTVTKTIDGKKVKVQETIGTLTLPFGKDTVGMLTLGGADEAGFKLVQGGEAIGKSNQLARTALNLRDVKVLRTGVNVHVLSKSATGKFIGEYENQVEPALQTLFPASSGVKLDLDKQAKRTISGYLFESFIGGVAGLGASGSQETFDFPGNLTSSKRYEKLAPHVYPAIKPGELIDTKRVSNISKTAHDIAKKYLNYTTNNKKLFGILGLSEAEVVNALSADKNAAKFANGGSVNGVNALLTPGEFVVDKDIVKKHGVGLFDQLNQAKPQGFAEGGPVARLRKSAKIGQIFGEGEDESGGTASKINVGDSTRYPGFIAKIASIAKLNLGNDAERIRATEIANSFQVEGSVLGYAMDKQLFQKTFTPKIEKPIFDAVNKVIVPEYGMKPINPESTTRGFASSLGGFIFQRYLEKLAPLQAAQKEDAPFDFVNNDGRLHQFDDAVGREVTAQYADAKRTRQSPGAILRKALGFENSRLIEIPRTLPGQKSPILSQLTPEEKTERLKRIAEAKKTTKAGGYATGGLIPSLLTPGEYVVPKATVQKYGTSFFNKMNAGGPVRGMKYGGYIATQMSRQDYDRVLAAQGPLTKEQEAAFDLRLTEDIRAEVNKRANQDAGKAVLPGGTANRLSLAKVTAAVAAAGRPIQPKPAPTPPPPEPALPLELDPIAQKQAERAAFDPARQAPYASKFVPEPLTGKRYLSVAKAINQEIVDTGATDQKRLNALLAGEEALARPGLSKEFGKPSTLPSPLSNPSVSASSLVEARAGVDIGDIRKRTKTDDISEETKGDIRARKRTGILKELASSEEENLRPKGQTLLGNIKDRISGAHAERLRIAQQNAAAALEDDAQIIVKNGKATIAHGVASQKAAKAIDAEAASITAGGGGGRDKTLGPPDKATGLNRGLAFATVASSLLPFVIDPNQSKIDANTSLEGREAAKRSGAISGGLTGALSGAAAGSIIPGVGTVLGGAAGAIFGAVSAWKEAEKQIREVEIGKTLAKVNEGLEAFSNGALSQQGQADLLKNLSKQEEQAVAKSRFNTVDKGIIDFFTKGLVNTDKAEADALKSARAEAIGPTLVASNKALAATANKIGITSGRQLAEGGGNLDFDPKRIEKKLQEVFDNPVNRKAVENLVNVGGKTNKEIIEIVRKSLIGAERGEFVAAQARLSQAANQELLQSFSRLADAVQNTTVQISQLSVASEASAAAFDNRLGGVNIRGTAERLSAGTNLPGFEQLLGQVTAPLGAGGDRLRGAGLALGQVESALTQAITETIAKGPAAFAGENPTIGSDLQRNVSTRLAGRGGFEALPKELQAILLGAATRGNALDIQKFTTEGKSDAGLLARTLLEDSKPIRDALAKIGKDIEENGNRFIGALAENQRRLQVIGEAEDKGSQLRGQAIRVRADQLAARQGIQGGGSSLLTQAEAEAPLNERQLRLTRSAGLAGAAAFDPAAIAKALTETQTKLREAAVAQQEELIPGAAAEEFSRLQGQANNLTAALKGLTETTERNAYAQERLSKIQEDRQARLSFGERFLTGGAESRAQINRGVGLAGLANQLGSVRGFAEEDRKLIFDTLNQFGGAKLPGLGFNGRTGTDIKASLIKEAGFDVTGADKLTERQLQNSIVTTLDKAAQAQALYTANLGELQVNLINELRQLQTEFFAKLGQNAAAAVPAGRVPRAIVRAIGGTIPNLSVAGVPKIGTDTVPAMLTPGEFVVNAKQASANMELLKRINSGNGPLYAANGAIVPGAAKGGGAAPPASALDLDDYQLNNIYKRAQIFLGNYYNSQRKQGRIRKDPTAAATLARDSEFLAKSEGDPTKATRAQKLALIARLPQNLQDELKQTLLQAQEKRESFQAISGDALKSQYINQVLPVVANQVKASRIFLRKVDNAVEAATERNDLEKLARLIPLKNQVEEYARRLSGIPTNIKDAKEYDFNSKANKENILESIKTIQYGLVLENADVTALAGARKRIVPPVDAPRAPVGRGPVGFAEPKPLSERAQALADAFHPGDGGLPRQELGRDRPGPKKIDNNIDVNPIIEELKNLRNTETTSFTNLEQVIANRPEGIPDDEYRVSITSARNIFLAAKAELEAAKARYRDKGVDVKALGFAKGGAVPGISGGDTVPAVLSPGEFVLTRNARALLGDNFLNSANRFATGGPVGGAAPGAASVAGLSELSVAMSAFTSPANALASALTGFGGAVSQLTDSLGRIPTTIHMEATHQVNVVHNGIEIFAQMEPAIQKIVVLAAQQEIDRVISQKFPDVGAVVR